MTASTISRQGTAAKPHLDPREHDGDQVVVREQEGSHHAAIPDVLYDGCRTRAEVGAGHGGAEQELQSRGCPPPSPWARAAARPCSYKAKKSITAACSATRAGLGTGWSQKPLTGQPQNPRAGRETQPQPPARPRVPTAASSPLTGFWCMESTKCRGFSMVYLRSRMVWEPVPSLHIPFLALLACSSSSASLLCSGLQGGGAETRSGQRHGAQRARGQAGRMLAGPARFIPADIRLSGASRDALAL